MNISPTTTFDPSAMGVERKLSSNDPAHDAAQSFIATALIQPILKQLRQTNNAAEPFAPGEFEKQFAPLMDQIWSEQVTRSGNWPLVEAVAQHLREQAGLKPAARRELSDEPNTGTDFRAPSRATDNTARSVLSSRGWLG